MSEADRLFDLSLMSAKSARIRDGIQQVTAIKEQFRQEMARIRYESRSARDADAERRILARNTKAKLAEVYSELMPLAQDNPQLGDALYYAAYDLEHNGSLGNFAKPFEV